MNDIFIKGKQFKYHNVDVYNFISFIYLYFQDNNIILVSLSVLQLGFYRILD